MSSEREMPFLEHLEELRRRLFICLCVSVATIAVSLPLAPRALELLMVPLKHSPYFQEAEALHLRVAKDGTVKFEDGGEGEPRAHYPRLVIEFEEAERQTIYVGSDYRSGLYYFGPLDPLLLRLKAALFLGLLLALPVWLWQFWLFVAPGLDRREKRFAIPVIASGLVLFPVGAGFTYWVLRFALGLLVRYSFVGLEPRFEVFRYLNFVLTLMLATGIIFESPLVIIFLNRLGLVSTSTLRRSRPFVVIVAFLLAATLTPPDPLTMLALALPLLILFELALVVARLMERQRGEAINSE